MFRTEPLVFKFFNVVICQNELFKYCAYLAQKPTRTFSVPRLASSSQDEPRFVSM